MGSSGSSTSGVDSGRGTSGAARTGTGTGTCFKGEISSLAVQVEFSKIGDEMIGLAVLPGLGGGKAGPPPVKICLNDWALVTSDFGAAPLLDLVTTVVFTGVRTGGGGATLVGSISPFFIGVNENPLKWPKNSLCMEFLVGSSLCKSE